MRRSRAETKATRAQLVETGGRLMRERGIRSLGIPELMASLGMTHGGFYRHFEDKLSLEVEALHHAFASARAELLAAVEPQRSRGIAALIDAYLDRDHLNDLGGGCPAAALSPDVARDEPALQRAFAQELEAHLDAFLPLMGGEVGTRRARLIALFAGMAGALAAARAVPPGRLRNEILSAARAHLLTSSTGARRG